MPQKGEWEVELTVSGPIAVAKNINLNVEKGTRRPFWTTAKIRKAAQGVLIKVIVRATSQEDANDSAVYFVGQTLDILSLRLDLPIYLSLLGTHYNLAKTHVKRVIVDKEWSEAFRLGREYGMDRPTFSRALGWYRKGLTSEDPIDKFIAYWSALEGVSSKLCSKSEKTKLGIINQICDCFDQLWSNVKQWKVIPSEPEWVNKFHETRNGITHGFMTVDVDSIREVAAQLPKLKEVAGTFLSDWEKEKNYPEPKEETS